MVLFKGGLVDPPLRLSTEHVLLHMWYPIIRRAGSASTGDDPGGPPFDSRKEKARGPHDPRAFSYPGSVLLSHSLSAAVS